MAEQDKLIRIEGRAGRITLNRPDALNALTHEMVLAIEAALINWRDNNAVDLVMIDATGERAFCAGGDVQKLYHTGITGHYEYMRRFWCDEYRLNAMITNYPKPYVAIMDGIVMGGGVGVSAHGSHRIVTSRTMLAMPECAIGLVPDVGGSFLLANAPGKLGEFMALTGARLGGADAVIAGFADILIETERLETLKQNLVETADVGIIDEFSTTAHGSEINKTMARIEQYFSGDSALKILQDLEQSDDKWALQQAKMMRRACPLSLACAWQMVRDARNDAGIEAALARELRFTWRSMTDGDVLEGVRALIIDKDRQPIWQVACLEEVTEELVSSMLASLDENELIFA